jgi:GT2 family glycosyltransferase
MTMSFVIVTFQSAKVIRACIDAVAEAMPDAEIIVVDNASTDGTRAIVEGTDARLHALDRNTGFAAAANCGARLARGPLVCFLNPDCLVDRDVCLSAVEALAGKANACATPDFAARGSTHEGRKPGYTRLQLLAELALSRKRMRWLGRAIASIGAHGDPHWHWALGTCLFVPRQLFLDLGGFDQRYFMYCEDVEFGLALHRAGGEVIALPHVVSHPGREGSDLPRKERERMLAGARIIYGERHYGRPFGLLLRLAGLTFLRS